jgi:hypothetical protein
MARLELYPADGTRSRLDHPVHGGPSFAVVAGNASLIAQCSLMHTGEEGLQSTMQDRQALERH